MLKELNLGEKEKATTRNKKIKKWKNIKSSKGKTTNNIQENPHKVNS